MCVNMLNKSKNEVRKCLLSTYAEYFVFQFAPQTYV